MTSRRRAVVVGGGAFGVGTARELCRRGWRVTLLEAGRVPDPRASSTDVSKVVRMDYGAATFYSDWAAEAIEAWREVERAGAGVFHEVGILLLSRRALGAMNGEAFEAASWRTLAGRGVPLERLDAGSLARRFPAWAAAAADHPSGYFNPAAGWVASGRAMAWFAGRAREEGVEIREDSPASGLCESGGRPGVELADGSVAGADVVVVAAGAWTPSLLPELEGRLRAIGQPVVHLRPADPAPFRGERFPVWCADIATTGFYGFPATAGGVLKVGHHGPGRPWRPGEPLEATAAEIARLRGFMERTFPHVAGAPLAASRLCLYCDSADGDFWIDRHPDRPGVVVAAGGSGHAFKFAPLLGELVADVVEERAAARAARFRWREPRTSHAEQARHRGAG